MFRNNYVDKRKAKKKSPRSEETKRKISDSLTGEKVGAHDFVVVPKDGEALRHRIQRGDNFKYQALIDWWRSLKE